VYTLLTSYQRARQGQYEDGLAILLEPDVWRGIPLNDYVLWANEVWHILVLRASRRCVLPSLFLRSVSLYYLFIYRGQDRLYREFLLPLRPSESFNPKDYFFHATSTPTEVIRDSLYEVIQMRVRKISPSSFSH